MAFEDGQDPKVSPMGVEELSEAAARNFTANDQRDMHRMGVSKS